jgi:septal ring factor EnvC (AmiA/AmiB activator)
MEVAMDAEKLPLTQPRQEVIDGIHNISTKSGPRIPLTAPGLDRTLIKISAVVIIAAILIFTFLLKSASMLKDSYQKGLHEGMASANTALTSAQETLKGQNDQISQLQSDLGKSNQNLIQLQHELDKNRRDLDSLSRQKNQMAEDLKKSRSRFSDQLSSVKQSYDNRIRKLTEANQAKVKSLMKRPQIQKNEELNGQLGSAQKDLEAAQAQIQAKDRLAGQLQQELSKSKAGAAALQDQLAKTKQALETALQEKEQLQEFTPSWTRNAK